MSHSIKSCLLAILSPIILWAAWPPHNLGWLSFIGFIPLLMIQDYRRSELISTWLYRLLIYFALLLWNIFTTWWVWAASPGGCIAAIVLNTLFMSIVWWLFDIIDRKSSNFISYTYLIGFWLAYELLHLNWEITWPWLILGNVFANNTSLIQWYEYTGHLGGSLWILLVNIILFSFLKNLLTRNKIYNKLTWALIIILVPIILSLWIGLRRDTSLEKVVGINTLIIQPNLNPYTEKFSDTGNELSSKEQLERMLKMAEEKITDETEFVIFPETALQGGLLENELENEALIKMTRDFLRRHPNTCIITGVDSYRNYPTKETETARQYRADGAYFDFYNAAFKIDTSTNIEIYHKSRLVPGVEKLPYPKIFGGLVRLLKLDAQAGGLGSQQEASVFHHHNIKIAPLICYESVFGGYVQQFLKKDANVLVVVTNDGWWGNTDGYIQHLAYGRLRCIEFRRDLLQCANTGLSATINSNGDIVNQTEWWKQEVLSTKFSPAENKTFYAEFGDFIGWLGVIISASILVWYIAILAGYRNK